MVKQSSIDEAYALLGLEQAASIDQVRSAYKQLALRMHPDKNQGNADATAQFQQLSSAYNILQRHLDRQSSPRPYFPCGHAYHSDDDYDDYSDDYGDCDEDFYDDDDAYEDERMRFFMFLFEQVMNGTYRRRYRAGGPQQNYRRPTTPETPEEYSARIERMREEQVQAEARRAQQKAERKAFEARMRDKERREAEERQRAKAASKKAEAEKQRKKAAQTAQAQQQRAQTLRSAAFAAARAGDATQVKKGVWEDGVDPAGGEVRVGCERYVKEQPQDPKETLLHIATQKGDVDLVEWLDAHSADPEERNEVGLSAFHVALQHGHIPIVKRFFESYDPKEEDHSAIYNLLPPNSLLSTALESAEPELVWMILDNGLASMQDIGNAWAQVTSMEGKQALLKIRNDELKNTEIQNLLMRYGGFTPPPTPKVASQNRTRSNSPVNDVRSPASSDPKGGFRSRAGGHYRFKGGSRAQHYDTPHVSSQSDAAESQPPPSSGERGRGRARGRGRGRGRGHARGD
ncbi:DnaJ-domain-containing protein [Phlebopus sp. FC_14]|nr:DnaJ-domain-containing protein [Phlebopus sp. FC_14]